MRVRPVRDVPVKTETSSVLIDTVASSVAGAVQRYQTDAPVEPDVLALGSLACVVAARFVPLIEPPPPGRTAAFSKLSFAGGPMTCQERVMLPCARAAPETRIEYVVPATTLSVTLLCEPQAPLASLSFEPLLTAALTVAPVKISSFVSKSLPQVSKRSTPLEGATHRY